jgi:hypothetical protein
MPPCRGLFDRGGRYLLLAVMQKRYWLTSTQWFLQNTKPEFQEPLMNNALFYSAGMSAAARRIAKETKKITIWDPWPCYLYDHLDHGQNPLRCIHQSDRERQLFFTHMSRAFAKKARNFSTVLHSGANYGNPPANGIWGSVEFPTLQRGGVVDFVSSTYPLKATKQGS